MHILHSCAFLNLKKTRFDAIIEFLRMADTAQVDRQDWCEKSFNILSSKMTPTIADKHTIGSLLNNDYDIWSETDKEKFAQKMKPGFRNLPLIDRVANEMIDQQFLIRKSFDRDFLKILHRALNILKIKIKIFDGLCPIGKLDGLFLIS